MDCSYHFLRPAKLRLNLAVCLAGAAAAIVSMATAGRCAEDGTSPLKQTYLEGERLAESAEGLGKAIAALQSVVEVHRANEEWYCRSLRRLAQCYADSGRTEEGMRFFVGLVTQRQAGDEQSVLREILGQYRLRNPELFKKVVADMGLSSGSGARVTQTLPSETLAKAILQREDETLRQKSLERLREMLSTQPPNEETRQGLATLLASLPAKFDREPFRALVLHLLQAGDAPTRALAVRCLPGLEATAAELERLMPLVEDASPEVRGNVGLALIQLGMGKDKEKVIPALIKLLQDREPAVVEQTIRSMWGQYSSPEFDKLLIELSREPRYHHNVIYFGLSTMRPKSAAVCRRLVEELDDPDWNNSGRAAWGLTYGVPDDARSLVEEGLLRTLPQETNAYTRAQEFRALRNVATEKTRAYLKKVAESDLETDEAKQLAREILAELDKSD